MKSKIRVFLGAFVNVPNAQNINCKSIAEHLDKSRFNVHTLSTYSFPKIHIDKVTIHNCFWPHRLSVYWVFFVQIIMAEVVYLPKGNHLNFTSFLCKLFNKKSMTTIEGIFDDQATKNAQRISGKNFVKYYHRFSKRFSITKFMKGYNFENHGLETAPEILYLGVESKLFESIKSRRSELKQIIMVGNDLLRKGVFDYIELSHQFPDLQFHLVGSGNGKIDIENELKKRKLNNFIFHGFINQDEIVKLLAKVQLHILPSKSEGFPKVILENACAGIPSIVYNDYGAQEWITNRANGFVVSDLNEIVETIHLLKNNPNLLTKVSINSIELGRSFDWSVKIKFWEKQFSKLYSFRLDK